MYLEHTKHIYIRLDCIRDVVEYGSMKVVKIHTSDNPTDMINKLIPLVKFKFCLDILNVKSVGVDEGAEQVGGN